MDSDQLLIHGQLSKVCIVCGNQFEHKNRKTCSTGCFNAGKRKGAPAYDKALKTSLERYGVAHPSKHGLVKDRMKRTNRLRWGHDCPLHSPSLQPVIAIKNVERHGNEHTIASSAVKERIVETNRARYGVDYFTETGIPSKCSARTESRLKRAETIKALGLSGTSKIEDEFFGILCLLFENVERFVIVNGWSIDFYVSSINTYVQLDGIYWHGLDRPIEVIGELKTSHDAVILKTYHRDAQQNVWFSEKGKKLIRITDKEFNGTVDKTEFVKSKLFVDSMSGM